MFLGGLGGKCRGQEGGQHFGGIGRGPQGGGECGKISLLVFGDRAGQRGKLSAQKKPGHKRKGSHWKKR